MLPVVLYQFHLENTRTGHHARVVALSFDHACKAVQWFNADVRLTGLHPIEALVLDKDEPSSVVYKSVKGNA